MLSTKTPKIFLRHKSINTFSKKEIREHFVFVSRDVHCKTNSKIICADRGNVTQIDVSMCMFVFL